MDDISAIEKQIEAFEKHAVDGARRVDEYVSSIEARVEVHVDMMKQSHAATDLGHKTTQAQWTVYLFLLVTVVASLFAFPVLRTAMVTEESGPIVAVFFAVIALMVARKLRTLDPFSHPIQVIFAALPAAHLVFDQDPYGFYSGVTICLWVAICVAFMELHEVSISAAQMFLAIPQRYLGPNWRTWYERDFKAAESEGGDVKTALGASIDVLQKLVPAIKKIEFQTPLLAMQLQTALLQNLKLQHELEISSRADCRAWTHASVRFTSSEYAKIFSAGHVKTETRVVLYFITTTLSEMLARNTAAKEGANPRLLANMLAFKGVAEAAEAAVKEVCGGEPALVSLLVAEAEQILQEVRVRALKLLPPLDSQLSLTANDTWSTAFRRSHMVTDEEEQIPHVRLTLDERGIAACEKALYALFGGPTAIKVPTEIDVTPDVIEIASRADNLTYWTSGTVIPRFGHQERRLGLDAGRLDW